ncbi:MAG TPA: FecR domain-containing protein [Pyrinomonadaceae bacterium]|nr:FecR domain-containing protein [Pyrinomonadaceae bacterium]
MVTRQSSFQFDWWIVQKRAVKLAASGLVFALLIMGAGLYVWKFGNPLKRVALKLDAPAGARFESYEGDVRVIHSATRQVVLASSDTQLYPGDTVQTQADGRARIAMADGSTVVVRPNSTIIIRDNESSEGGKRSNVHVVVDSGQMLVRTQEQTEGAKNVVETPNTKNQIGAQTNASFGVSPEGTEEIRVNAGSIESQNHSGERTTLNSGEYVSVNQSGTISKPQRLLEVPQPAQPHDLEKIIVGGNGVATVPLRWLKPQTGVPAFYRVEVATSPFFVPEGKVIERDQLILTQFSANDLRPGAYFWRVRATASTGQTSDWSEPKKFIVSTQGNGSATVVVTRLSSNYLGGDLYIIRGSSAPGTTISVSGRETMVGPDGNFQVQVTANVSLREVTIMAFDPQGNRSQYRLPLTRNS